jgi:prepilin-type processing-associated H-X9-DG protein
MSALYGNELRNYLPKGLPGPVGIFRCPGVSRIPEMPSSELYVEYGYNSYGILYSENSATGLGMEVREGVRRPVLPSGVVAPANMIAIADGFRGSSTGLYDSAMFIARRSADTQGTSDSATRTASRHKGQMNTAFCDGHCAAITLKTAFEDVGQESLSIWNRDALPHAELLR